MIQPESHHLREINVRASRMVENQHKSVTLELVGYDHKKHDVLEELIEQSKPPVSDSLEKRHYLIRTPFRYPPLIYGSRFGTIAEQGIFYCSLSMNSLLTEVAYYRFVFLYDMHSSFSAPIKTEHSVFDVRVQSKSALCLDEMPWDEWRESWCNKTSYSACQNLGLQARDIGSEVIRYYSARDEDRGRNIAVLNHLAIKGKPKGLRGVRCEVEGNKCVFTDLKNDQLYWFDRSQFEVNGTLPLPA